MRRSLPCLYVTNITCQLYKETLNTVKAIWGHGERGQKTQTVRCKLCISNNVLYTHAFLMSEKRKTVQLVYNQSEKNFR